MSGHVADGALLHSRPSHSRSCEPLQTVMPIREVKLAWAKFKVAPANPSLLEDHQWPALQSALRRELP